MRLPDAAPWWIDFSDGSVSFRETVFKHPGVIVGSTGIQVPASLRAGGSQTVYWWMNLTGLVGTPSAPGRRPTSPLPHRPSWRRRSRRRVARRR